MDPQFGKPLEQVAVEELRTLPFPVVARVLGAWAAANLRQAKHQAELEHGTQ